MEALTKPCQNCHKPMNGGLYRAAHVCPHCLFEHEGGKSRFKSKSRKVAAQVQANDPVVELDNTDAAALAPQLSDTGEVRKEPTLTRDLPVMDVDVSAEYEAEDDRAEADDAAAADLSHDSVEPEQAVTSASKPTDLDTDDEPQTVDEQRATAASAAPSKEFNPAPRPSRRDAVILTTKAGDDHNILNVIDDLESESVMSIELTPDLFENGKFVGVKSEKIKAALVQGKKNALAALSKKAQKLGGNIVTYVAIKNSVKASASKKVNIIVKASGTCAVAALDEEALEI